MRADAISSTADWMASGGGEERAFVECARAGLVRRVVYFRSLAYGSFLAADNGALPGPDKEARVLDLGG